MRLVGLIGYTGFIDCIGLRDTGLERYENVFLGP